MDETKCEGNVAFEMLLKHKGDIAGAVLEIIQDETLVKPYQWGEE
jgi:hypothetical protein